VDRSLRRLGQLLVVMAALLGAVLGVALALTVENAQTSGTVAASGRERAEALAASPPSNHPPTSPAASSGNPVDGNDSSGHQRAQPADRADRGGGKAGKNGNGRRDKADGHGKNKPGKGKGK
jgi:hypothetical protein